VKSKEQISDPDLANVGKASARAAKRARQIAMETGTPFYVWKDGRVVDLLAAESTKRSRRATTKQKKHK